MIRQTMNVDKKKRKPYIRLMSFWTMLKSPNAFIKMFVMFEPSEELSESISSFSIQ
jgi:hypothetical protein